jgi:hypothetical protein
MTSYISQKFKTQASKAFRDSFKQATSKVIGYVYLGKTLEFPNESSPPSMTDTPLTEKDNWENMVGGKRILPKDVEMVIPRYNWQPGARYKQYDDSVSLDELLSESVVNDEIIYPMYVMNSEGNVYKCLCNNVSQTSEVEPTGNFTENEGFIQTEVGSNTNYLWKYMYNVKLTNKFLTDEWMPIPYIQANTSYLEYNYNDSNLVDGTLNKIKVINSGTGYYHPTINVSPFVAGQTQLYITDINGDTDATLTTTDLIKDDMSVSGNGIYENRTHISFINFSQPRTIYLSTATIGPGGGNISSNKLDIETRIVIDGDGTETVTSARLSTSNTIEKIDVINSGTGFTRANVSIYGSGLNAEARVILPPKFGHGYNPAVEFGANNVMIISRIGEIDSTENNKVPNDIFFRQYGILVEPHKYGEEDAIEEKNALESVSLTLKLDLLAAAEFQIGEMVYQGTLENITFSGYVVSKNLNEVRLNKTYKTPNEELLLIGSFSNKQNRILSVTNPDLEKYSGNILFAKNIVKVQRSEAQAEEIKLVFQF